MGFLPATLVKNINTIIMEKEKNKIEKKAFLEIDDSEAYENNSNEIEDIADLENEINYAETSDESLSSISLLMKDITKYPLLSKEDEIEAFSALEAAKTPDEIKKIKEHIVNANYRLVFSIAKRYAKDDDIMDKFQTVIMPKTGWFDIDLKEVWRYRDLISLFVKRNFVSKYKQTILGPLWAVIQPLLTTVVFTVVFGSLAGLSADGVPPFLFYLSGNVAWTYFSACLLVPILMGYLSPGRISDDEAERDA